MKKCPFCAEEIQEAAIVCKHCHRDLPRKTEDQSNELVKCNNCTSRYPANGARCPECGYVNPAAPPDATVLPRTQRERRPVSARKVIGGIGVVLAAVFVFVVIGMMQAGKQLDGAGDLGAVMRVSATTLSLENGGTEDWPQSDVTVTSSSFGTRYHATLDPLDRGKTATMSLRSFISSSGERFDPIHQAVTHTVVETTIGGKLFRSAGSWSR